MDASEVAEAIRILETDLPRDIEERLRVCLSGEEGNSREALKVIIENIGYARQRRLPMCQDTGTLVFFVKCAGSQDRVLDTIREGISLATREVPLRPNTVNPFTRENEGRNLGRNNPIVHFVEEGCEGGKVTMQIMAKGAGSENVSRSFMLEPDRGVGGIKECVIETVADAGGKPCPPIIVGLGVGGSLEWAAYLAKKALLRPLDRRTEDPTAAQLEDELLPEINSLGIGPMGMGGRTTALGVRVEWAHCHTASLPVSVSVQCWALRRVSAVWDSSGFRILR
jgi:fumarate hydratase subunit alpha